MNPGTSVLFSSASHESSLVRSYGQILRMVVVELLRTAACAGHRNPFSDSLLPTSMHEFSDYFRMHNVLIINFIMHVSSGSLTSCALISIVARQSAVIARWIDEFARFSNLFMDRAALCAQASGDQVLSVEWSTQEAGQLASVGKGGVFFWFFDAAGGSLAKKQGIFDVRIAHLSLEPIASVCPPLEFLFRRMHRILVLELCLVRAEAGEAQVRPVLDVHGERRPTDGRHVRLAVPVAARAAEDHVGGGGRARGRPVRARALQGRRRQLARPLGRQGPQDRPLGRRPRASLRTCRMSTACSFYELIYMHLRLDELHVLV